MRSKSMDWFLYGNGLRHERVKIIINVSKYLQNFLKRWVSVAVGGIHCMIVTIYEILFPFDIESQILTYEEMIRVFPDKRRKRPVVLIGNFFSL